MTLEDIYNTLRDLDFITAKERTPPPPPRPPPGTPIKYLRGRKNGPGITRRGLTRTNTKGESKAPLVIPTEYTVHWNREELDTYVTTWRAKEHVTIQPRCLKWSPFILSRARKGETVDTVGTESHSVQDAAGATGTELDRSSASSTKVTQEAHHDVAVSTPKLSGEHSPAASGQVVELHPAHLTTNIEDSNPLVNGSASIDACQVAEDRALAAELARTSEPLRHLRSTRSKSLREASVEGPKSSQLSPSEPTLRALRSKGSANTKRKRNAEEEVLAELEISRDSALAAMLAREEGTRQTRSMSNRLNPPKTLASPSPRKRRRVESSPSTEPDVDSLSELTHTSASVSPSPPPRRVTRAANGRSTTNGTAPKSMLTPSANKPLTTRLSLRTNANGPTPIHSDAKGIGEVQARTRSMRGANMGRAHDDNGAKGEEGERTEEVKEGAAGGFPTSLVRSAAINGWGLEGVTPGLYEEDALGEEDAEGEEDLNSSDNDR
jgi:hypothetical protein